MTSWLEFPTVPRLAAREEAFTPHTTLIAGAAKLCTALGDARVNALAHVGWVMSYMVGTPARVGGLAARLRERLGVQRVRVSESGQGLLVQLHTARFAAPVAEPAPAKRDELQIGVVCATLEPFGLDARRQHAFVSVNATNRELFIDTCLAAAQRSTTAGIALYDASSDRALAQRHANQLALANTPEESLDAWGIRVRPQLAERPCLLVLHLGETHDRWALEALWRDPLVRRSGLILAAAGEAGIDIAAARLRDDLPYLGEEGDLMSIGGARFVLSTLCLGEPERAALRALGAQIRERLPAAICEGSRGAFHLLASHALHGGDCDAYSDTEWRLALYPDTVAIEHKRRERAWIQQAREALALGDAAADDSTLN